MSVSSFLCCMNKQKKGISSTEKTLVQFSWHIYKIFHWQVCSDRPSFLWFVTLGPVVLGCKDISGDTSSLGRWNGNNNALYCISLVYIWHWLAAMPHKKHSGSDRHCGGNFGYFITTNAAPQLAVRSRFFLWTKVIKQWSDIVRLPKRIKCDVN